VSDIADFLRARIAERRALADGIHSRDCESVPDILYPDREPGACDCGEPEAAISHCDAKLALVDLHAITVEKADAPRYDPYTGERRPDEHNVACAVCGWASDNPTSGCTTLRILAQPFAGHPDHKGEEWAP
jgi:hypothetical protein